MKYKHIVFDIDGTLLDTATAHLCSLQQTLKELRGIHMPLEDLNFAMGLPGNEILRRLQIENPDEVLVRWLEAVWEFWDTAKVFPGIPELLQYLKNTGHTLGIITSETKAEFQKIFVPFGLLPFFDTVICFDDSPRPKPNGDPMLEYLKRTGANPADVVFVGDSAYDVACAKEAQVTSALALWGCRNPEGIQATYRLSAPQLLPATLDGDPWLDWAIELQSIAQTGLTFSRDPFDVERFHRLRELSAEMVHFGTGVPKEKLTQLFCNETGYQTPKLETRAAVFQNGNILLVKERLGGEWSLPGGWVDVNQSVGSNTEKEVREEAGLDVVAKGIIAVQDRKKHTSLPIPYGVCKVFVYCELLGGSFTPNIETVESGFFPLDKLPPLSEARNSKAQVELCFRYAQADHWVTLFD